MKFWTSRFILKQLAYSLLICALVNYHEIEVSSSSNGLIEPD